MTLTQKLPEDGKVALLTRVSEKVEVPCTFTGSEVLLEVAHMTVICWPSSPLREMKELSAPKAGAEPRVPPPQTAPVS